MQLFVVPHQASNVFYKGFTEHCYDADMPEGYCAPGSKRCLCRPGSPAFWFQNDDKKFDQCLKTGKFPGGEKKIAGDCFLPLNSLSKEIVEVFSKRIIDSAETFCKPFESLPPYSCSGRKEIHTNIGVVASSALSYAQISLTFLSTAAVLLLSRMVDRNAGQSEGNGRLDPLKEKGGNMDGSLGSSSDRFDPDTGEPISRRHRVPVGGDASLNRFDPDTGEPISHVARVPPTASAKRDQYSTSEDLYKEPLLHGGRGGGGD